MTGSLNEEGSDGIPVSHVSNAGPHRHITHAVSEHTVSDSVMESPGPGPDNNQDLANSTQKPSNDCVDIGLPGPSAGIDQEKNITQQEINKIERRKIIRGCCLDSSDEDEDSEVVQPPPNLPVNIDSWRTELFKGQTDHNYSSSATQL